jgi:tRNA nucleotidyltransferase (CCA-adding enzyme)
VRALEIIIPHINTDLDALGAAVGAQVLYPQAVIVMPGSPGPLAADFISLHRYYVRVRSCREIDPASVTRAIVVDTADPARLGPLRGVAERVEVHLYDHHPPEPDDLPATVEVRDMVGATCTLVAELIEEAGAPLTPVQATAMLLGIYADTGSLNHMGTTERDARAAAFLLSKGANLRAVGRFIQGNFTPAQQALLHQLQNRGRWITAQGARIRIVEAEVADYVLGLALVVHRLLQIQPAHSLFAVVQMAERVYLVGRSEVPWVDAGKVMAAFGGGGHPAAASAVVKGAAVPEVVARLETVLARSVAPPPLARDLMTSPVKTIVQSMPVREAERLMLRYGHSGLPVVDEGGRLVGMISLRDVERAQRNDYAHVPVKGMMVHKVVTVPPDMPMDEVQDLMLQNDIGRVPVVAEQNLVGIITRSDLLGQVYGGPAPHWHRTLYEAPGAPARFSSDPAAREVSRVVERAPAPLRDLLRLAGTVADEAGVSAYAVGGFVRDLLLGRPNLDLDIVAEGNGITYAHALARAVGGRVTDVPRFGTAHIYLGGASPDLPTRIDVSTARREFYEHAAALPLVEHADLREDLYRRDFSINAMAIPLDPEGPGGLVDFFGGWQDLTGRQIRILHSLSFVEDPTRILRAVRFAARYGFALEPETAQCARQAIAEGFLERVTVERLRNELLLMLQEPFTGAAVVGLQELGALKHILPDLQVGEETLQLLARVDRLPGELPDLAKEASLWPVKLLVLLYRLPLAEGLKAVTRLKLRRDDARLMVHALSYWRIAADVVSAMDQNRAEVARTLADWPPDGLLFLCLVARSDAVLSYWRQWRHVRLEITGADLIGAGVAAGPKIRRILAKVLSDRLDGQAPDREAQFARALRYAQEED